MASSAFLALAVALTLPGAAVDDELEMDRRQLEENRRLLELRGNEERLRQEAERELVEERQLEERAREQRERLRWAERDAERRRQEEVRIAERERERQLQMQHERDRQRAEDAWREPRDNDGAPGRPATRRPPPPPKPAEDPLPPVYEI